MLAISSLFGDLTGVSFDDLPSFRSYNVCQGYLESPYNFKDFLLPSYFRGIKENVNPLPSHKMLNP